VDNRIKERSVFFYNSSQDKLPYLVLNRVVKTGDVERTKMMTTSENLSSEKTAKNMPKS
jgi:hypothetical protein